MQISKLPQAETVNDDDLAVIVQDGETKNIKRKDFVGVQTDGLALDDNVLQLTAKGEKVGDTVNLPKPMRNYNFNIRDLMSKTTPFGSPFCSTNLSVYNETSTFIIRVTIGNYLATAPYTFTPYLNNLPDLDVTTTQTSGGEPQAILKTSDILLDCGFLLKGSEIGNLYLNKAGFEETALGMGAKTFTTYFTGSTGKPDSNSNPTKWESGIGLLFDVTFSTGDEARTFNEEFWKVLFNMPLTELAMVMSIVSGETVKPTLIEGAIK